MRFQYFWWQTMQHKRFLPNFNSDSTPDAMIEKKYERGKFQMNAAALDGRKSKRGPSNVCEGNLSALMVRSGSLPPR
jgi:hypothetical protein